MSEKVVKLGILTSTEFNELLDNITLQVVHCKSSDNAVIYFNAYGERLSVMDCSMMNVEKVKNVSGIYLVKVNMNWSNRFLMLIRRLQDLVKSVNLAELISGKSVWLLSTKKIKMDRYVNPVLTFSSPVDKPFISIKITDYTTSVTSNKRLERIFNHFNHIHRNNAHNLQDTDTSTDSEREEIV